MPKQEKRLVPTTTDGECENCGAQAKRQYDIQFTGETATEIDWWECEECGWESDIAYGQSWPEAEFVASMRGEE
jgi:RNase P subunit RPR2